MLDSETVGLRGMPLPRPDLDTQFFWDGCQEDRFLIQRCRRCGATRWPPGPMCPECQSTESDHIEASGAGTVYSWIVATHPVADFLVDQVPYIVAMIDLEEGVRVVGNVVDCPAEDMRAGMPVELFFESIEDIRLPNFKRAKEQQP